MTQPNLRYSMMINWSDTNQAYIVCIPEFGPSAVTHGKTWEEAMAMGKDLMESLIGWAEDEGKPLPEPLQFDDRTNYAPDPFDNVQGLRSEVEESGQWSDKEASKGETVNLSPLKPAKKRASA